MLRWLSAIFARLTASTPTATGSVDSSERCRACAQAWRNSGYNAAARCPRHQAR